MRSFSLSGAPLLAAGALLSLLGLATPACYEDGGATRTGVGAAGGGGGAEALSPLDRFAAEYCQPLAEILCDRAALCACDAIDGFPAGRDACIAQAMDNCTVPPGDIATFLEHGAYVFRFDFVAECLDVLRGQTETCQTQMNVVPSACMRLLASVTPIDGSCSYPVCASGEGFCTPTTGTCVPIPTTEGEPCDGLCVGDLTCVNGVCEAIRDRGQPCEGPVCRGIDLCVEGICRGPGDVGEACADPGQCRPGLLCADGKCADGPATCTMQDSTCGNGEACLARLESVCQAGAVGSTCSWDAECAADAYCPSGACVPLPGAGEACAYGVRCQPGLGCDPATTICGALPGEGATCAWIFGGQVGCAGALGCVAAVCTAMPGEGQPCTDDLRCGAGLGCDNTSPTPPTCAPLRAAGDPCVDHRLCDAGLFCDPMAMVCTPYRAAGEPCIDGKSCGPTLTCLPGPDDAHWVCGPTPGTGDPCYQNCPMNDLLCHDCAPGLVCGQKTSPGPCAAPICTVIAQPR